MEQEYIINKQDEIVQLISLNPKPHIVYQFSSNVEEELEKLRVQGVKFVEIAKTIKKAKKAKK